MKLTRRRAMRAGSVSLGALAAGCVSLGDPGTDAGNGNDDESDDSETGGDDSGGDVDDRSIDARLHNEDSSVRTFQVTILSDGEGVASDEWDVDPGSTRSVPGVGAPGESRTFEVTVGEETAEQSISFDVESTPGNKDGHVEITYTAGGIDISFTPADENGPVNGLDRVDEPPYEITEPPCDETGDRDPLWLCANMDGKPTLPFEQVETSSRLLPDEGLDRGADTTDHQYYATILTKPDDLERVEAGGEVGSLLEDTEFETHAVLVVQTGWGSGSETPHLKRIEAVDDGIHAFGCYRRPCFGTTDHTARSVVVRFERPDGAGGSSMAEHSVVSLTVDPETRVTVGVSEGVVTVPDDS